MFEESIENLQFKASDSESVLVSHMELADSSLVSFSSTNSYPLLPIFHDTDEGVTY